MELTYLEWRRQPTELAEIDPGGFILHGLSTSLHRVDGQLVLTLLEDASSGRSTVVRLTEQQANEIERLLPPSKQTFPAIRRRMAELNVDDAIVLGRSTNHIAAGLTQLAEDGAP